VTRRESIIVAFALAVTALAIVIVMGHVSIQVAPNNHLPALNGTPPPKPTPGSVGAPAPQPTPAGSSPPMQAARTRLSSTGGQQSGAQCRPSTATGNSPRPSSGSTAQQLLPPGLALPIATPSAPPLPVPTP
jgi:hypothetical protein